MLCLWILIWALPFTIAWTFPWHRRISSHTNLILQKLDVTTLKRTKKEAVLRSVNSPYIRVKKDVWNSGRMILETNRAFPASSGNRIRYRFDGSFINQNLFVVYSDNLEIPIQVTFSSGVKRRKPGPDFQTTNNGIMILLSNGSSLLKDDKEFNIDLPNHFCNAGSLSILGTKKRRAQIRIKERKGKAPWRTAFLNQGVFYLRNAVLYQEGTFARDGCIVLGEGSSFIANPSLTIDSQQIRFLPGRSEAELYIRTKGLEERARYVVVNFPRGSSIRVDSNLTEMKVWHYTVNCTPFRATDMWRLISYSAWITRSCALNMAS